MRRGLGALSAAGRWMALHPATRRRVIGTIVFVAAVATLGWFWYGQHSDAQTAQRLNAADRHLAAETRCLNNADARLVEVSRLRGSYTDQDSAATQAVISTVARLVFSRPGPHTAEEFRQVFRTYLAAEAKIKAERAAHPLPVLRGACKT